MSRVAQTIRAEVLKRSHGDLQEIANVLDEILSGCVFEIDRDAETVTVSYGDREFLLIERHDGRSFHRSLLGEWGLLGFREVVSPALETAREMLIYHFREVLHGRLEARAESGT